MVELTFITPVGPYHHHLIDRARATVAAQTVHVAHLIIIDEDGVGAGAARNQGLARVTTPFVSFLDCDDALDPRFAERCLQAFDGQRYVYTDWIHGKQERHAIDGATFRPDKDWSAHLVNAVIPTRWALEIGGFDAQLPGGEDADFYLRLHAAGHCGLRLAAPLVTYSGDGRRSLEFARHPASASMRLQIWNQTGAQAMACCGGADMVANPPVNEQQPGFVLVRALGSNRHTVGRYTGNVYPRVGHGNLLYVHPEDARREPRRFELVESASVADEAAAWQKFGQQIAPFIAPKTATPILGKSDKATVLELWGAPKPETVSEPPRFKLPDDAIEPEKPSMTAKEVAANKRTPPRTNKRK